MYQLPPRPAIADINALQQQQVPESLVLDYKRESYGTADDDKRDLLKDVVGLANANGGHIVLGVEAQASTPTKVLGIPDAGKEIERLVSIVRSCVDPRLFAFEPTEVPNGSSSVIVLFVPKSPYGPHMITFKGFNQYWKRVGTSNQPMSTAEIREHCLRTETLRSRLEEFLEKQWTYAHQKMKDKRKVYVGVTPVGLTENSIDTFAPEIRDLMKVLRAPRTDGTIDYTEVHEVIPTLEGAESRHSWQHGGSLRVFRNGHVDYLYDLKEETDLTAPLETYVGNESVHKKAFWPHGPITKMLAVLRTAKAIQERAKVVSPFAIQYGFIRVTDLASITAWGGLHPRMVRLYRGDDPDIRIQVQLESNWDPAKAGKHIADWVYNAFNWEDCPFVTEEGKVKV